MKSIIATLLMIGSTSAFADTCSTKYRVATVSMGQQEGLFSISYSGPRMNYNYALYAVETCKPTRVGASCTLIKMEGQSVGEGMPETLKLKYGSLQNIESATLFGLFEKPVVFSSRWECPQITEGSEL